MHLHYSMNKLLIELFEEIKNIKYEIPLKFTLNNSACSWKIILLKNNLNKLWIKSNYRICSFYWKDLNLPKEILNIPHDDFSSHVFLEIQLEGKMIILDPTWDSWLKNIFHINNWDGNNDTQIAVKVVDLFSIDDSEEIMNNINKVDFDQHIIKNHDFYNALNSYLHDVRFNNLNL